MTDAEYIEKMFRSDSSQKKRISRGAANKVKTNRGAVKFPSDYLSAKEKKKMNSETVSINLNAPTKWKNFKTWPVDLQKEYLDKLTEKYGVPMLEVAGMLGVHKQTFLEYRKKNGFQILQRGGNAYKNWDEDGWLKFLDGAGEEASAKEPEKQPERYFKEYKPAETKKTEEEIKTSLTVPQKEVEIMPEKGSTQNTVIKVEMQQLLQSILGAVKGAKIVIEINI